MLNLKTICYFLKNFRTQGKKTHIVAVPVPPHWSLQEYYSKDSNAGVNCCFLSHIHIKKIFVEYELR